MCIVVLFFPSQLYLYLYRKNFSSVCLSVCLFPVGTRAISSQTAPSCDLKISPIVYQIPENSNGPFIITNFHHKRRNLQSAHIQSGPARLFCARASQIGLFRSGRKTSTPTFQLIPFFRPLSTSSSTSLCVYGSSSGYFYSFNAFLSLYHSLEALIASKIRSSADGNVGFSPDMIFFQNIRRGEHSLFLTFLAPTKAPIPTHCVFIASLRPVLRRFRYILVRNARPANFYQNKEHGVQNMYPAEGSLCRMPWWLSGEMASVLLILPWVRIPAVTVFFLSFLFLFSAQFIQ